MTARQSSHWPSLDGLRGIASLSVMVYHFFPNSVLLHSGLARTLRGATHVGWIGVDLFFALSGFLITGILLRAKGGPFYLRNFYARRILRIFPLYYLALVAVLVIVPHLPAPRTVLAMGDTLNHQGWLWGYAYNLRVLFTGQFWADDGIPLSHFWSLSVEEHFYLFWPLLVLWMDRRALLRIAGAAVLLAPLARAGLVLGGVSRAIIYTFTLCRIDTLLMGAIVALVASDWALDARLRRFAPATAMVCAVGFGLLVWKSQNASSLEGLMATVGYSVLALGSAAVLMVATRPGASLLIRVLSSNVLRWLGRYSYGAYVLHLILRAAILRLIPPERVMRSLGPEFLGVTAYEMISIAVTMGAAIMSFHLFEMPFLRMKRFFEYQPPADAASGLSVPVA